VKITPFGLEKSQGDRKFRIKEFDKEGKFQIIFMLPILYYTKQ
jgi:hypothetical protein